MLFRFSLQYRNLLIFSATLLLFSCSQTVTEHSPTSTTYIFTSIGYAPIAAQTGESFDLQMLNAIKASKLEAYKELAEQIYGVLLHSENDVSGARLQDDMIESRVEGLVRGARVLKSYHEGDVYITELELDMRRFTLLQEPEFNQTKTQPVIDVKEQVYY